MKQRNTLEEFLDEMIFRNPAFYVFVILFGIIHYQETQRDAGYVRPEPIAPFGSWTSTRCLLPATLFNLMPNNSPELIALKESICDSTTISYAASITADEQTRYRFQIENNYPGEVIGLQFNMYTAAGQSRQEIFFVQNESLTPLDESLIPVTLEILQGVQSQMYDGEYLDWRNNPEDRATFELQGEIERLEP